MSPALSVAAFALNRAGMEPSMGIEPILTDYETVVIPVDQDGVVLAERIELPMVGCKPTALPLGEASVVASEGIEPS